MPKNKLTPKQRSTLAFIKAYQMRTGRPPSLQEIATAEEISVTSAKDRLEILERKGCLELTPNISRGIKLITYR